MTEHTYDVIVLGGGSAGTAAARTAADAGARTAMFNDGELGGLCILRGCMPTKTMLHAAHLVHEARHHVTPGVGTAGLDFDFKAIMANKDAKVARFKRAKITGIEAGGYEVIDARARFTGPDTVEAGGQSYRFAKGAVIATGSVTNILPLPGLDEVPYLTSDEIMQLERRPASVIVIGTGAIGLEMSQFFARLGTEVCLVCRRPILANFDPALVEEMRAALRDEPNLELHASERPLRVRRTPTGIELDVQAGDGEHTLAAEALVIATGRRAAVDDLSLEAAGVELDGGAIVSGRDMRTTNPKVFAAGDARGVALLLHVANWEGHVAGLGAAQVPGVHEVETRLHMEVVFTDPAIAIVGLTEDRARAQGLDVIAAEARFPETGRAITQDVQHGIWRVVADRKGEILGSSILGPRADDLIHTMSAVMYYRGTASDMLEMPWYHPTLSEVALSLARDLQAQVDG